MIIAVYVICCRADDKMRENLYQDITNSIEYSALGQQEQQVIESGLRRSMCLRKAMEVSIPDDVNKLCESYELM